MTGSTPKIILTALLVALAGCEQPDDTQNQASAVPGNLSANAMGNAMSPPVQTSSENISGNDSSQQKEPLTSRVYFLKDILVPSGGSNDWQHAKNHPYGIAGCIGRV